MKYDVEHLRNERNRFETENSVKEKRTFRKLDLCFLKKLNGELDRLAVEIRFQIDQEYQDEVRIDLKENDQNRHSIDPNW